MSLREKLEAISSKMLLLVIACGVWTIVLQNAGVIPRAKQKVHITGGRVDVDNTVDVNLQEINGASNAFYDFGGNGDYVRIPVYAGR